MNATMTVEEVERGLINCGVPKDKARSVALQQAGIFVPAPQPFTRKPSVKEPVSIPASDPDAGRWELWLPIPDSVTNGGGRSRHYRTVARRKVEYFEQCDILLAANQVPPRPATPFSRATLAVTLYLGHKMDQDGAVARCKAPVDWLVTRGYIVDDRDSCLTWLGFPRQIVSRRHVYGVHLTLTATE